MMSALIATCNTYFMIETRSGLERSAVVDESQCAWFVRMSSTRLLCTTVSCPMYMYCSYTVHVYVLGIRDFAKSALVLPTTYVILNMVCTKYQWSELILAL